MIPFFEMHRFKQEKKHPHTQTECMTKVLWTNVSIADGGHGVSAKVQGADVCAQRGVSGNNPDLPSILAMNGQPSAKFRQKRKTKA